MNTDAVTRLRRVFVIVAVAATLWAVIAALTGGVSVPLGPIRISSRNPQNPFLIALLAVALAWAMAPKDGRAAALALDARWLLTVVFGAARRLASAWMQRDSAIRSRTPARLAPVVAAGVAVAVSTFGLREGALVAAGADASGYVSQADLWARGMLRDEPPLMRELTMGIPREAFAPLAYIPAEEGLAVVPVVSPGLPMIMAVFQIAAGREAVFLVVPLLAGVAVAATYLLGTAAAGPWIGVAAAILLAASPSFLFQLTSSPMSDIPVTAWWALALAAVLSNGRGAAFAAGLAAGVAILTRANLVPLALVPALWLLREVRTEGRITAPTGHRLALFAAGVIPACITIAVLYNVWYGSPFNSGYGEARALFGWDNLRLNLARYPRWLVASQTPAVILALTVPLLVSTNRWTDDIRARAVLLLVFIGLVFGSYAFYESFDAWWFLRFLLPAYPAMLVLTSFAVVLIVMRVLPRLAVSATVLVVALVAWHGVQYARAGGAFNVEGEWKYATAGRYIADHLPERALIVASQHSGSARYYSRRPVLFVPWIPGDKLDWVVSEARRLGYQSYALLEDWEEPDFRQRFMGARALEKLDVVAEFIPGGLPTNTIRIYRVPEP